MFFKQPAAGQQVSLSHPPSLAEQHPSADLPRIWIQPHYASFNGIRGVAVFLVFLTHFGQYILPAKIAGNLWFGVDLFFVLSGFLITGILFDSLHDPHFFRNFYIRRALRIFPIFYTFFLLLLILTPILHLSYEPKLWLYCFYVGNLFLPFLDLAHHNPTIILWHVHGRTLNLNIGHLWSLCVEEQFYLMWPAVVWLLRARTRLMRTCVLVAAAVLALRIGIYAGAFPKIPNDIFMQWSTVTRLDTLVIGAFFALWLRDQPLSRTRLRRLSASLVVSSVALLAAGLFVCKFVFHADHIIFLRSVGYTLIALAAAGIILRSLDDSSALSRFLRIRSIAALGVISYGFYFIHHLFMYEAIDLVKTSASIRRVSFLVPFAAFALSWTLARLSFHFLESPFLRLKSRLAPQWIPSTTAASPGDFPGPVALHVSEPQP